MPLARLVRLGVRAGAALAWLVGAAAAGAADLPVLSSLAPYAPLVTDQQRPRGVAAVAGGIVYFTDEQQGRLYEVASDGSVRVLAGDLKKPRGIAVEDAGHLLLLAEKSGQQDTGLGGVLLRVDLSSGALSELARGVKHARGLFRAADGSIYVTSDGLRQPGDNDDNDDNDGGDAYPGTVLRLGAGGLVAVATGFKHPDGILGRPDGSLLVSAEGHRTGDTRVPGSVFEVSPTGAVSLRVSEALRKPGGLVADRTGAFFFGGQRSDGSTPGVIVRRSGAGATNDLAASLRRPAGLAFTSRGDLIATDAEAGIVWRFQAPAGPSLNAADPSYTNRNPFALSGMAAAGTQVLVTGGSATASAAPAPDGSFTVNVPLAANQESELAVVAVGAEGTGLAGAAAELSVVHDDVPPQVAALPATAPNAAGWYGADVIVAFECADGGSGIASCAAPVTVATEGAAQAISGTAADRAGNVSVATLAVSLDKTPPVVTATPSPAPNAQGWNNSDVTVSFQATDALSGVAEVSEPATIVEEGTGRTVFGSAIDVAGNQGNATFTTNLDKTPPAVAIVAPEPGAVRRVPNVVVSGTASDGNALVAVSVNGVEAGDQSPWSAEVPLQDEGPQTLTARAEDVAGNSASASVEIVLGIAPVVHITAPADLSAFGTTPITVSGTVDDPQATITVGLEAVPALVSGNSFTATGVPLREGGNVVTAAAADALGNASSDSVTLVLDTTAPRVLIDSPASGSVTTDESVSVTGRINDVVLGTVNSGQAQVTVNGIAAEVANRTFIARGVPLAQGQNAIVATAADAVGNSDTQSITVMREALAGPRIQVVSGDGQTAVIGETLAQALTVRVADGQGLPLGGRTVVFRVAENNGVLIAADGSTDRGLVVPSDGDGLASARFTLGSRSGVGNNQVEVTSPGIIGGAVFMASGTARPAQKINLDSGNGQIGAVGQPLPRPFVAVVTDAGHNRLGGVPVTFRVVQGDGVIEGASEATSVSDGDGRALAVLTLGPRAGIESNVVTATAFGLEEQPATFAASAEEPGDPLQTSISGVVLDNSNVPIAGVALRVRGTALATTTDAQGQFRIPSVPVGNVHLQVDGTTAQRPGNWPSLDFELVTVPGIDNTLGMPVYLVQLDTGHSIFVDETHGGTLTLPEVPGFSLTVAPNSAAFPDGTRRGTVSVTPVHVDKVPMVPNFGQQPRFIVTIQPPGVHFDPPAGVTHPNVDGLKPGEVTEIYSFDHDMGSFVATGTATVSEDGTVLRSDPGMGILKGGWHCGGNPAGAGTPHDCPECRKCDGSTCVNDDGAGCDDSDQCTSATGTEAGADKCQGGSCQGKKIEFPENEISVSEEVTAPEDLVEKVNSGLRRIPGLSGIKLDEIKGSVEGLVKDCCEKTRGVVSQGIKEASASIEFKADVKGITLFGPPTITKQFDLGFMVIDLDFEVGAKIDANISLSGKGGTRQDLCQDKTCLFGEIKGQTTVTAKATARAILCVETFWTTRHCGSIEVTPLSFSAPISLSGQKNIPDCGSPLQGSFSFGKLKFKVSFGFGITDPPTPTSGSGSVEGFSFSYPPLSISYEKTILDGFTITFP